MSRMLTQGATMLGEHCDRCGNPLFRVEGEEVCAVCSSREVDSSTDDQQTGDSDVEAEPTQQGEPQRRPGEVDEATAEVRRNLTRVVQRLSGDAAEEQDVSRLNQQLDALQKAVDLLERL